MEEVDEAMLTQPMLLRVVTLPVGLRGGRSLSAVMASGSCSTLGRNSWESSEGGSAGFRS